MQLWPGHLWLELYVGPFCPPINIEASCQRSDHKKKEKRMKKGFDVRTNTFPRFVLLSGKTGREKRVKKVGSRINQSIEVRHVPSKIMIDPSDYRIVTDAGLNSWPPSAWNQPIKRLDFKMMGLSCAQKRSKEKKSSSSCCVFSSLTSSSSHRTTSSPLLLSLKLEHLA